MVKLEEDLSYRLILSYFLMDLKLCQLHQLAVAISILGVPRAYQARTTVVTPTSPHHVLSYFVKKLPAKNTEADLCAAFTPYGAVQHV